MNNNKKYNKNYYNYNSDINKIFCKIYSYKKY